MRGNYLSVPTNHMDMHEDSGWRPDTGCQQCNGHETWTHTAPHEINDGQKDPDEMDLGLGEDE